MKRHPIAVLTFTLCIVLAPAGETKAELITVSSCDSAALQSAVDSAVDGDEVYLSCPGATWSSVVTVTRGITLRGTGQDSTVITADGTTLLDIDVSGGAFDNIIPIYPNGYENPSASEIYRVSYVGGEPWTNQCDDVIDRTCSNFRSHCSDGDHRACSGDYDCPDIGTCVDACEQDTECPAGTTCLQQFDGHQDSFGWPCRDQTGRGQDDPVTHVQASSPVYWWNNQDPSGNLLSVYIAEVNADYIKPNRDYYEEVEGFDGTAGVGRGTLGSRPSTCAPGTAYWAADENRLYVCTETDTWSPYYTPLAYPHPLIAATDSLPPSAPANLRVH